MRKANTFALAAVGAAGVFTVSLLKKKYDKRINRQDKQIRDLAGNLLDVIDAVVGIAANTEEHIDLLSAKSRLNDKTVEKQEKELRLQGKDIADIADCMCTIAENAEALEKRVEILEEKESTEKKAED